MAAYSYMIYQHGYEVNCFAYHCGHQHYHWDRDLTHFDPMVVSVLWELSIIYFSGSTLSHSPNDVIGTYLMKRKKKDPNPPVKYNSWITVMIHTFR